VGVALRHAESGKCDDEGKAENVATEYIVKKGFCFSLLRYAKKYFPPIYKGILLCIDKKQKKYYNKSTYVDFFSADFLPIGKKFLNKP
jgi:hypothetical protein